MAQHAAPGWSAGQPRAIPRNERGLQTSTDPHHVHERAVKDEDKKDKTKYPPLSWLGDRCTTLSAAFLQDFSLALLITALLQRRCVRQHISYRRADCIRTRCPMRRDSKLSCSVCASPRRGPQRPGLAARCKARCHRGSGRNMGWMGFLESPPGSGGRSSKLEDDKIPQEQITWYPPEMDRPSLGRLVPCCQENMSPRNWAPRPDLLANPATRISAILGH